MPHNNSDMERCFKMSQANAKCLFSIPFPSCQILQSKTPHHFSGWWWVFVNLLCEMGESKRCLLLTEVPQQQDLSNTLSQPGLHHLLLSHKIWPSPGPSLLVSLLECFFSFSWLFFVFVLGVFWLVLVPCTLS